MKFNRELKNTVLLSIITSLLFLSGLTSIIVLCTGSEVHDITSYDAESNILAFVPYADSGLDTFVINEYPKRDLIASYDGSENPYDSSSRVNFKIGEWKYLGCDNDNKQEYFFDNDTKLIRSEFWFETDVLAWTDLDYEDVFSDGSGQFETNKQYRWLHIEKQHSYGWGLLNSLTRICAWDQDLYNIYLEVGSNPSDSDLTPYINPWYANLGRPYWYKEGLKQLLSNSLNYMPNHYNKYLKWNQLSFPGNPTNLRDFSLNQFNDFRISGDLYFDVNMKESFWNRLTFPDEVEVKDNVTGDPLGLYMKDRIVYSIDTSLVLGPNDPNYSESRTKIVDLQDLYDNLPSGGYADNTAEGNMVASTENNEPIVVTTNAVQNIEELQDLNNRKSMVPKDIIGDGQIVLGVVDRTADWNWEYSQVNQGPNAQLPGTTSIEPLIWKQEERPEVVTEQEIYNLKPLDAINKQDFAFGYNIKDRDEAIFKTRFKFGPKLQINYATLDIQEIALTMQAAFTGGYNEFFAVTEISDLTHVPYSANIRNIGMCQTLKLKVIALTTYNYEPYGATEPGEINPEFPLDDSDVDWPDEVETGGDMEFTAWETSSDIWDAFIGWFLNFGWLFVIIIIAILGLVLIVIIKFMSMGSKTALNTMEQIQKMAMGLKNFELNQGLAGNVRHIQSENKSKATLVISFITIVFSLVMLFVALLSLF
jgi:hypothetical protein